MFLKEFVKHPSTNYTIFFGALIAAFISMFFINTDLASAQSYQQQQLSRYQQQVLAKRQRYMRYQRQKQKQNSSGFFGNLFGGATVRKRRVYRRQRAAIPAPIPTAKTKTSKKTRLAKSNTLGAYGNGKKARHSKLPKSFSKKKRKPSGRRAMCVRLCDGFYWPVDKIGGNLKKQNVKSICQTSCSATTRVYYSAQSGGDTAKTMRDLRGNRYRDLKNAFVYRKEIKRSCRCRPEPWSEAAQKMYKKRLQKADELPVDITGTKKREKRTATLRNAL